MKLDNYLKENHSIKDKMNHIAFNCIPISYEKLDNGVWGKFYRYGDGRCKIIVNETLRTLSRNDETFKKHESTLWHEVGHYIHRYYFKGKTYIFNTTNKSLYAYKNHFEDFAEAFSDFMCNKKETTIRNLEIESLLKTIF